MSRANSHQKRLVYRCYSEGFPPGSDFPPEISPQGRIPPWGKITLGPDFPLLVSQSRIPPPPEFSPQCRIPPGNLTPV